jgi:hypothetical protein
MKPEYAAPPGLDLCFRNRFYKDAAPPALYGAGLFSLRCVPRMDVSNIYAHDGRLLRVIEDTERDTLTMEVKLPVSPDSEQLVPRLLVFEDVYGYQVFEGPFQGVPTILDIEIIGEQARWRRIRIDTNAGHRELFCAGIRIEDREA